MDSMYQSEYFRCKNIWTLPIGLLALLLIYTNYRLSMWRANLTTPAAATPSLRVINIGSIIPATLGVRPTESSDIFFCSQNGVWVPQSEIGFREHKRVHETDMQLRMRKGWPMQLFHGDLRCGRKYPLPRVVRFNNTEAYYSDIASQCDAAGGAPCCRDDIGWCGRGDFFCSCDNCIDYSQFIHADLATWVPADYKCTSQFSVVEVCQLLSSFTSLTFIGDSLVRHVFSALLLHLTNDSSLGALKHGLPNADYEFCKDENQFVDSSCHAKLATSWIDMQKNEKYCSECSRKPRVEFIEAYASFKAREAQNAVLQRLHESRPVFAVGIGIHDNFDPFKVSNLFLSPLLALKDLNPYSRPLFIWFNSHAAGPLKPIEYQESQGNNNILHFNSAMWNFCRSRAVPVLDTFNLTSGIHSFDGTHYGKKVNKLKSSMLLNGLIQLARY